MEQHKVLTLLLLSKCYSSVRIISLPGDVIMQTAFMFITFIEYKKKNKKMVCFKIKLESFNGFELVNANDKLLKNSNSNQKGNRINSRFFRQIYTE